MDKLFHHLNRVRHYVPLQIFTIYLRYLIGGGFVIAAIGMGKLSGEELAVSSPGVPIQDLVPLQQFFRVMATSGLYWSFIGWMQIVSGVLLMTQRYAKIGALIFFGMILNIFVITLSYHFQGTPFVTGLMLLAALYLIIWDLDTFQPILMESTRDTVYVSPALMRHVLWKVAGVVMACMIIVLALVRINVLVQFVAAFSVGLGAFLIWVLKSRRSLAAKVE